MNIIRILRKNVNKQPIPEQMVGYFIKENNKWVLHAMANDKKRIDKALPKKLEYVSGDKIKGLHVTTAKEVTPTDDEYLDAAWDILNYELLPYRYVVEPAIKITAKQLETYKEIFT